MGQSRLFVRKSNRENLRRALPGQWFYQMWVWKADLSIPLIPLSNPLSLQSNGLNSKPTQYPAYSFPAIVFKKFLPPTKDCAVLNTARHGIAKVWRIFHVSAPYRESGSKSWGWKSTRVPQSCWFVTVTLRKRIFSKVPCMLQFIVDVTIIFRYVLFQLRQGIWNQTLSHRRS